MYLLEGEEVTQTRSFSHKTRRCLQNNGAHISERTLIAGAEIRCSHIITFPHLAQLIG